MERNGENLQINFHGNKLTLALDEIKYFEGRAMRVFVTMMDEHQISFDWMNCGSCWTARILCGVIRIIWCPARRSWQSIRRIFC